MRRVDAAREAAEVAAEMAEKALGQVGGTQVVPGRGKDHGGRGGDGVRAILAIRATSSRPRWNKRMNSRS